MTGIKQKFILLNLLKYFLILILLMVQSHVLGSGVVQATQSLTLTYVLYVLKFLLAYYPLVSLSNIITAKQSFFSSHCVFQDLSTGRRIGSRYKRGDMYYLDDRVTPTGLVVGQLDTAIL